MMLNECVRTMVTVFAHLYLEVAIPSFPRTL